MKNATYIALSRLDAQQRAMSVVANNIANASTSGFKAQHVLFGDYISQQDGEAVGPGGETQAYTQDLATFRDLAQGQFQSTGNPLDLALGGEGYFTVAAAGGTRLTRSGRFERLTDGTVTDEVGNALLDDSGRPLRLPVQDHDVTISSDGTVTTESGVAGKIGIVLPDSPNAMQSEGSKLLRSDGKTTPVTEPKLVQGMLEGSNVQIMSEMTRMMDVQRTFQFMAQFVESEATRQQDAISKIVQISA